MRNIFAEKFLNKSANGKLKDIIFLKKKNIKTSEKNSKLKYYPIDTLPMNYLLTKNGKDNSEAQSSLIEFNKYDILLGAMRVYFHRVCLAANGGITRNTTFVFNVFEQEYLYYALMLIDRNEFIDYANMTSKGTTMPYAVWEALAEYDIYIPKKEELKEFNTLLQEMFKKMINSEKENLRLEQLRDALLPKLMNGEIDIDKVEI